MDRIRITLCGHVDAGKSTLAGHLLYRLNVFSDRDLETARKKASENKMDSWSFAYLLDTLEEEQLSGKTRDYIETEFTLDGRKFILTDTPGHHQLIPAMIEGANATQIGFFVLSMKSSEFQKCLADIEHIILFRCMGVKRLIVLLNKVDLATAEQIQANQLEASKMLKKIGYAKPVFLQVSALTGDGFEQLIETVKTIKIEPTELISHTAGRLILKGLVLTKMISPGYCGVLHGNKFQQEVEIDSVLTEKKTPYARKNETCIITINLRHEETFSTRRFILRNGEETVFLGSLSD